MQQDNKQAVLMALNECWTVHKMLRDLIGRARQDSVQEPELRRLMLQELPRLVHSQEELIEGRIRAMGSEMERQQGAFVSFAERLQSGMERPEAIGCNLYACAALLCSMHQGLLACSVGNMDHATALLAMELCNQSRELEHMMWPLTEKMMHQTKMEQIIPPSEHVRKEVR